MKPGGSCGCNPGRSPAVDAARDLYVSGYRDAAPEFDLATPDAPHDARVVDAPWTPADARSDTLPDAPFTPLDAGRDVASDAPPVVPPETPAAPPVTSYSDLPFNYPASLKTSTLGGTPALFATNGAGTGVLSRMPFGPGNSATSWSTFASFAGYPFDHEELSDGRIVVTHSSPHGIMIVNGTDGSISQDVDFSTLALGLTDPDGTPYAPTFPGGAALLSGLLCTPLANLDPVDYVTYHAGKLLCFPYADGTATTSAARVADTSGKNPTGIATYGSRFVVISSNTYDPTTGGGAFVDLFDSLTLMKETILLGEVTAQSSANIAITAGGLAVIGLYSPAHLMTVDLETQAIDREWNLEDDAGSSLVTNFITNVALDGGLAVLSDAGVLGGTGRDLFVDLNPAGWTGIPFVDLPGNAGPATISAGTLYQSVTMGDAGAIDTASLAGVSP